MVKNAFLFFGLIITCLMTYGQKESDILSEASIAFLKQHGIKVAGLSGHDSCDWSLNAFEQVFQDNYIEIKVGKKIIL